VEQLKLEIVRIRWDQVGMRASLRQLSKRIGDSQDSWFLLQYTALGWSNRGFPARAVRTMKYLKARNACCAVVFHDAEAYAGNRWIDHVRRTVQLSVMRRLLKLSDVSVFTVPRQKISWIPASASNVVFIPVGANLPAPEKAWNEKRQLRDSMPVVAIFSITGGQRTSQEVGEISAAVKFASKQTGPLRVVVFGRNSDVGGNSLKAALAGSPIEITVMGLIPAEEIVQVLGSSDVLLFVRGPISSRRGSAIAGIACGLPVIAQEGSETAPPITDAGVVLVPADDPAALGPALLRVLTDHDYRASLAERSRNAQERYFSWSVIAAQYARALQEGGARP
jgi:glycosyltransferase involved in cell wall biosynthesis